MTRITESEELRQMEIRSAVIVFKTSFSDDTNELIKPGSRALLKMIIAFLNLHTIFSL